MSEYQITDAQDLTKYFEEDALFQNPNGYSLASSMAPAIFNIDSEGNLNFGYGINLGSAAALTGSGGTALRAEISSELSTNLGVTINWGDFSTSSLTTIQSSLESQIGSSVSVSTRRKHEGMF